MRGRGVARPRRRSVPGPVRPALGRSIWAKVVGRVTGALLNGAWSIGFTVRGDREGAGVSGCGLLRLQKVLMGEERGFKRGESKVVFGGGGCHKSVEFGSEAAQNLKNEIVVRDRKTDKGELVCNRSQFLEKF